MRSVCGVWSSVVSSLFVLLLGVTGCSASEHDKGSDGKNSNNAGGSADAGTGAGGSDFGSGNGDGGITPLPPLQDGGAAGGGLVGGNIDPIVIDDCGTSNSAGVSASDAQKLKAGSGSAGGLRYLYPYAGTVFPRGLLAPTVMWDGAGTLATDVVYLHIKSIAFEYFGCLKPTAPGQLLLAQDVWDKAAAHTYGQKDPYTVELTVMSNGTVTGPAVQTILIAMATVKGSIYYNSYSSRLPGFAIGGKVLRIPSGKAVEAFEANECNGCHSVSADGSRLLTQRGIGGGAGSAVLLNGGAPNPALVADGLRGSFGALYPDGSKYVVNSGTINVARSNIVAGPLDAVLVNTDNAMVIPSTGIPPSLVMPMFSPSGKQLVFANPVAGKTQSLGLVDWDNHSNAASNNHVIFMETDPLKMPAWPFFFPDDKGLVFLRTDAADFSGGAAGILASGATGTVFNQVGPLGAPWGDLHMLDLATGKAIVLAKAMGYDKPEDAASDKTYLPFGASDLHHNYYPTVSPVAAGGYFWVFFDSYRNYGNFGLQRQLWGTAVDISPEGNYTIDRSHPSFYLPGQEFGTGNHRAFAALDPCKMDDEQCESGIECCSGFCLFPPGTPEPDEFGRTPDVTGKCSGEKPKCSKLDERCSSDADCCAPPGDGPDRSCIGGFCAVVQVPD